ncbi:hypothetical protein ITJ44_10995 [Clavibacter sp. VKM Ac-2873]|uniref:hypothetical protein n=1 Tax=Clavibacter sp. VKM Ac-2873 TaxID=2783813 RepID=UPI00188ADADF|nr:hypothetical protein [Clavibacter sp. VKM Ac-2873]MBF4618598.1 hypothetical protein [Clavibacter sp. VKM Ac-2873]
MSAPRTTVGWVAVCAAAVLTMSGCALPSGAGGLASEDPPIILPTSTATPTPTVDPEEGGFTECADASPAALAAVNASIAAHPGPSPGLHLDGLETVWDADEEVWTLAGMVGPMGEPVSSTSGHMVALWATDQDPTREDFAGTIWSAVNGSDMVSDAPRLESFRPLTMDDPDPAGLWCSDLYPEADGGTGG